MLKNCCRLSGIVVGSQPESSIMSHNSTTKNDPAEIQPDNLIPTCTYMATNLGHLPENEWLKTSHHALVSASWFTSSKCVKQFGKWLKAENDQPTATKAWSDDIADCYLNKLDLTYDRKQLPFIDINPTDTWTT